MTAMLTISVLAFLLGMRHATDADHVIAVTTIVTRHRSLAGAVAIGAAWGFGHSITILVVGGGIILLGWAMPVHIELSMEFVVGIMLIALGIANLDGVVARVRARFSRSTRRTGGELHTHEHGDYVHTHAKTAHGHLHAEHQTPVAKLDRALGGSALYQLSRPLVVGVVHGLAGSAAVALLVLATIPSPAWSVAYLLVFGLGTILGMMFITAAISLPLLHPKADSVVLTRRLRTTAGVLSLAFGLFLVYRVGIVEGLFRML